MSVKSKPKTAGRPHSCASPLRTALENLSPIKQAAVIKHLLTAHPEDVTPSVYRIGQDLVPTATPPSKHRQVMWVEAFGSVGVKYSITNLFG